MRARRRGRVAVGVVVGTVVLAGIGVAAPALAAAPPAPPAPDDETSQVARDAHAEPAAAGTPCSVSARACVDLETQQAWLIRNGAVTRGPVPVTTGGAGLETPVGHSFRVYRKEADHRSGEFDGPDGRPARMPWSTFFADGGIAFHGGDRSRASSGCVKLDVDEARIVFDDLAIGDKVQVVNASVEAREREALTRTPR